ncbi:hypothetical protein [Vibrio europaeus]|uniref:hypothetical protein n=1 Tax=Vibrio europaeus TaxID=300876 RepID=UPI00233F2BBB|nr:hypothetical protein [Vibrio europaeus]MDC5753584.1 hypothetical protein [Vibrio europaeus]MDC5816503.1 hypothetical protein [Vibrio europaeus]
MKEQKDTSQLSYQEHRKAVMKEFEGKGFAPFLRSMASTFGKPSNVALYDAGGELVISLHPVTKAGTMIKARTITEIPDSQNER